MLLLQGPMGPFFRRLARALLQAGAASVHKVNFNGGDQFFYARGAIRYRGTMEAWPSALSRLMSELQIDTVFLFGDCREIHRPVQAIARERGAEVWVFEEGYVRPDFVTLERSGVNNHSPAPRDPAFYNALPDMELPVEKPVGNTFWYAACWATFYYTASILMRPFYRHYRHHRPLGVSELLPWLRSPVRKLRYRMRERRYGDFLCGVEAGRFYLVPLQVGTDFQVRVHSDFDSVSHFVERVVASFARHAPTDHYLVLKHHPMDRGYSDYSVLIRALAERYGVQGRLHYIHDQHLPTLLDHASGVVLINSTVGLSAMNHGLPVAVLGDASYALPGMSYQGGLDSFWSDALDFRMDKDLYRRYRNYLIRHTQLNGDFFRNGVFEWKRMRTMDVMRRRAAVAPSQSTGTVGAKKQEATKRESAKHPPLDARA
ncbi:MAG: capsular biosynthesis protein [Pseudomonadota bacterium]|uniref:capsule biosynthesis protein n=1 Tax=Cupriavidus metallidurans TaxID=119219 RepID=UPI001F1D7A4E|nr:capsular biosynthesis protein [Cupriavidus metallidurans]